MGTGRETTPASVVNATGYARDEPTSEEPCSSRASRRRSRACFRRITVSIKRVRMILVTHLSAEAEASHLTTVLEARDRSSVCFATTALSAVLRANEELIAAGAAALTETRRAFAEARARTLRVGVARARALPETAFAPARGDAAGATCPRARTVDACMRCSRSDTRACVLECRSRGEVRSPGAVPTVVGPSSLHDNKDKKCTRAPTELSDSTNQDEHELNIPIKIPLSLSTRRQPDRPPVKKCRVITAFVNGDEPLCN